MISKITDPTSNISYEALTLENPTESIVYAAARFMNRHLSTDISDWVDQQTERWGDVGVFESISVGTRSTNPRKWLVIQYPSFMREVAAMMKGDTEPSRDFYLALAYLKGLERDTIKDLYSLI